MNRSFTYSTAVLLLVVAGGLTYWQIARDKDKPSAIESTSAAEPGSPGYPRGRTESRVDFTKLTDNSVRWELRVDMLRRMEASQLGRKDVETLFELLHHQPDPGNEEHWWVVVNEIMEQMRLQAIGSDRYGREMLAIVRDADAPEVLRDYAVQHLGQWVTPRGAALGHPHEQDTAITREAAETFAMLAMDPSIEHTSVPGTALMLLVDMNSGGVDEEIINPVIESLQPWFAATLDGRNQTGKITRISAINAIGMLELETFHPDILAMATDENADPNLRLNSVAVLGQIGGVSDITTLETIAATDNRYYHAARAALEKINAKREFSQ